MCVLRSKSLVQRVESNHLYKGGGSESLIQRVGRVYVEDKNEKMSKLTHTNRATQYHWTWSYSIHAHILCSYFKVPPGSDALQIGLFAKNANSARPLYGLATYPIIFANSKNVWEAIFSRTSRNGAAAYQTKPKWQGSVDGQRHTTVFSRPRWRTHCPTQLMSTKNSKHHGNRVGAPLFELGELHNLCATHPSDLACSFARIRGNNSLSNGMCW